MFQITNNYATLKLSDYIREFHDLDKYLGFCKVCKNYGKVWTCPNYDFEVSELLSHYEYIHFVGSKVVSDISDVYELIPLVRKYLDAELLEIESKAEDSRALFAGSCIVCETCARISNQPCRSPHLARYSLESIGFDVVGTASKILNTDIIWEKDGITPPYRFMVSAVLSNLPILDTTIQDKIR